MNHEKLLKTDYKELTIADIITLIGKTKRTYVAGNTGIVTNPNFTLPIAMQDEYIAACTDVTNKFDLSENGTDLQKRATVLSIGAFCVIAQTVCVELNALVGGDELKLASSGF